MFHAEMIHLCIHSPLVSWRQRGQERINPAFQPVENLSNGEIRSLHIQEELILRSQDSAQRHTSLCVDEKANKANRSWREPAQFARVEPIRDQVWIPSISIHYLRNGSIDSIWAEGIVKKSWRAAG